MSGSAGLAVLKGILHPGESQLYTLNSDGRHAAQGCLLHPVLLKQQRAFFLDDESDPEDDH